MTYVQFVQYIFSAPRNKRPIFKIAAEVTYDPLVGMHSQ